MLYIRSTHESVSTYLYLAGNESERRKGVGMGSLMAIMGHSLVPSSLLPTFRSNISPPSGHFSLCRPCFSLELLCLCLWAISG